MSAGRCLTDRAKAASDPRLTELADKLTEAAKTGDLSGLHPRAAGHGRPGAPPPPEASTRGARTGACAERGNRLHALESIVSAVRDLSDRARASSDRLSTARGALRIASSLPVGRAQLRGPAPRRSVPSPIEYRCANRSGDFSLMT